ncbi:MAG TPA: hypothetical protein VJ724_15930 [Tahibacter sp.]|nr:hypothetical protein [Tahibacter sp.]
MFGITAFGLFHTAISLVSLFSGLYLLARYREISWHGTTGKVYVGFTIATCLTGLCIFRHGTFGPPHALAIATLVVLGIAWYAERLARPGSVARIVAVGSYTATVFFHFIPAFTETATRIPEGAPLASGPEDPNLQAAIGAVAVVFAIFGVWQVLRIRRERRPALA